jgi:xylulokinase
MNELLLAIDVGTTATKCLLLDPGLGVVAEYERPVALASARPGWAEEDPDAWWANVRELTAEAVAGASGRPIAAVGVTGMVPALVCLDAAGRPLRAAILQNDARADREIDELREALAGADVLQRTGSAITQQSVGPKLLWLRRNEPGVLARTASVCGSYDFVASRLTGVATGPAAAGPVEANWALESGLYDFRAGAWAEDICRACGVDPGWLGRVVPSASVVGTVAMEAVPGLAGVPVITAGADHVAGAFAAGLVEHGDVVVELGGAGNILAAAKEPVVDERLYLDHHLVPGGWVPNGCMATTGSLVRWFQREIGGGAPLGVLDAEAAEAGPGAGGLVLTPYFLGEKTPINDPLARGTVIGLHLGHRRGHLFRAVLEGVAFAFRHHIDVLRELGVRAERVNLTGGGASSALWRQIIADVLELPVVRRDHRSGAALGAAFAAGMGAGVLRSWSDITSLAGAGETVLPDPRTAGSYGELYAVYRSLYPALLDQQHTLARWRLFLYGPAHRAQMLAKAQGGRALALREVGAELYLCAQRDACPDALGLAPLGIADRLGQREDLLGPRAGQEEHSIIVAQNQILAAHRPVSDDGGLQRVMRAGAGLEGASGDRSQAEDRQPDRPYVSGVAMQPPDHHSCQTGYLSLQSHQVTDARLIEPPAVVDDEHVARRRRFKRLQEDVDAASVPGGTDAPGHAGAGHHRAQERGSAAHGDPGAYTRVGDVGCGEGREPVLQHLVIHDEVSSLRWPRGWTGPGRQPFDHMVLV